MQNWIVRWLSGRRQRVCLQDARAPVTSGVPKGSCLGPLLFLVYINNIDDCVDKSTIVSKFADDTKAGRVVENEQHRDMMQNEINNLVEWTEKYLMKFNIDKCKILHVGRSNMGYDYKMGNKTLEVSRC